MTRGTNNSKARRAARVAVVAVALGLAAAATAEAQSTSPFGYISVGFGTQAPSKAFTVTATETINAEQARYEARYGKKGGPLVEVGFGIRVRPQFYVGLGLTQTSHTSDADVTASVPHPFFFNRHREAAGRATGVKRDEMGAHVHLAWRGPIGAKLELTVFGGPSWVAVEQGFVEKVTVTETYPFDTTTFQNATVSNKKATAVGGSLGADVTYRLGQHFGLGGQVRFVAASADVELADGQSAKVKAGGVSGTAGLRIFF